MKRVFICGDDTYPLHHPVDEIRKELYAVLDKPPLAVTADTEHFEGMDAEDLAQFDLVVMYSDHWPDKIRTSSAGTGVCPLYCAGRKSSGAPYAGHDGHTGVCPVSRLPSTARQRQTCDDAAVVSSGCRTSCF